MSTFRIRIIGISLLVALAACDQEDIMEGERFGTSEPLSASLSVKDGTEMRAGTVEAEPARPITLPDAQSNANWPQRGATAQNHPPHAAFGAAPAEAWNTNIGTGNSRRARITADPVVAAGRIFTLDAQAGLQATSTEGAPIWSVDLTPGFDRGGRVSGGALAVADDTVYATTGYGELVALNVADGAVRWRQRLGAGITAPTVDDNTVYVVSRDSQAWAINTENGRILWQLPAAPSGTVLIGGAAPAVTDTLVVFPFGSGELIAALRLSGVRVWGTTIAGPHRGVAYNNLNDITGDPVVRGDIIYAGNQAGRVVALEAASGERLWTATDGAYSPPLPAGDSIFFVSDRNELIRLDTVTGERIWSVELPLYVQETVRWRKAVFTHFGPILAGGRLIVASGDGLIRMFSPETGDLVSTLPIQGGAAALPVVAGGTLYVVSQDGRLHAFR